MSRVHVFVSGKVQGVFYRDSTRQAADARGVAGWVRNLPDGRVEAVFEGPQEALEALVDWCRGGPPLARVTGVDATWGQAEEGFGKFEIRSTPRPG